MTRRDDTNGDAAEMGLSPLGESSFAVEHGLVGSTPDVAVVGAAVRRARHEAELSPDQVAEAMTRRGYPVDAAWVVAIESAPVNRLGPRQARLLAAILDRPLPDIEATAEPWPAGEVGTRALRRAGVEAVTLGSDVVVRTEAGSYLGLLRCSGDASVLDSRTYRTAAASRLSGGWSHLAGALLVTEQSPHMALAVDALDCVSRPHAPSGLSGFSRLPEPEPLAQALAAYDRTYVVRWTDPAALDDVVAPAAADAEQLPALAEIVADLQQEARRARQLGKRTGYERVAGWLAEAGPDAVGKLIDDLADAADEAEAWALLDGEMGP